MAEGARLHHETAIGLRRANGKDLVLAPRPGDLMKLQPGDKIVVFADNFDVAKADC